MESNKKHKALIISSIIAVITLIIGITYAFFNYTRTGSVNSVSAGKIRFSFTEGDTINLENVFPVSRTEAQNDDSNNSKCEIIIRGNSTYKKGVEYKISTVDTHVTITRDNEIIEIPVGIIVNVSANGEGANDNLGNEDVNYFANRDSYTTSHYKKIIKDTISGDQMIFVGFIAKSDNETDNSINGKITIKAFFDDDKLIITDTPEEADVEDKTIISSEEWYGLDSTEISFRIKVEASEGIWVNMPLYEIMNDDAVIDNTNDVTHFINNATPGIDFSETSSDTNGKGVYKVASTQNDTYPILYYRGNIENNNVVYANKCWQIVRTTTNGNTKVIYNGEFDETTKCNNSGSDIGISLEVNNETKVNFPFGNDYSFMHNNGYMHGTDFYHGMEETGENVVYGSGFTYNNGVYTLTGTQIGRDNTHHYTCSSTDALATCEALKYYYYVYIDNNNASNNKYYYIQLNNGNDITDILTRAESNTVNSEIKNTLEDWYEENLLSRTDIKDEIYCNDRRKATNTHGFIKTGNLNESLTFAPLGRANNGIVDLSCQANDSFGKTLGNQENDYPIGLITSDEVIMAGGKIDTGSNFYLNANLNFWTMSPAIFDGAYANNFFMSYGVLKYAGYAVTTHNGVRPVITLSKELGVSSGTGTKLDPYILK